MGGGLMQLVAYGAQDIYLTGNPQITFFKVVYRRHTNFSMETIQQTLNGSSTTSQNSDSSSTVTISRNGDLVSKVYVHLNNRTPGGSHVHISNGLALIKQVELEIGGQRIDRHTQEWNEIYSELFVPNDKSAAYGSMVGSVSTSDDGIHIPLNFWFCRNPGLALPLIALQYHEVKLKFTFGSSKDLQNFGTGAAIQTTSFSPEVWCDYIYLDTDERRRFAQVSHEYLIEQVQYQSCVGNKSEKLNFNHPVKELIWTQNNYHHVGNVNIQLNGHDRFAKQDESYFQLRQPYEYHSAVPNNNLLLSQNAGGVSFANIASFTVVATPNDITTSGDVHLFWDAGTIVKAEGGKSTSKNTIDATTALNTKSKTTTTGYLTLLKSDLDFISDIKKDAKQIYHWDNTTQNINWEFNISEVSVQAPTAGSLKGKGIFSANATTVTLVVKDTKISDVTPGLQAAGDTIEIIIPNGISSSHAHGLSVKTNLHSKINVYSFALKPEEHQPSGTCNFSRIDTAKLNSDEAFSTSDNIYAVNYNVLRIMSGMGGLAYSN
tara:strand:+ start:790 stop:2427 length:1638 start_codon:yes stop_codon:yes gene_type:complete